MPVAIPVAMPVVAHVVVDEHDGPRDDVTSLLCPVEAVSAGSAGEPPERVTVIPDVRKERRA